MSLRTRALLVPARGMFRSADSRLVSVVPGAGRPRSIVPHRIAAALCAARRLSPGEWLSR